jgi:hypothetical protein
MAMADELLEQKEWTIAQYLELFDPSAPDTALIRARSDKIQSIVVKKLRAPSGQVFEDTTFIEKAGASYTIRTRL